MKRPAEPNEADGQTIPEWEGLQMQDTFAKAGMSCPTIAPRDPPNISPPTVEPAFLVACQICHGLAFASEAEGCLRTPLSQGGNRG